VLFFKYKMSFDDATKLYGKYIATWGDATTIFRFEGYIKGERVCLVEKRDLQGRHLQMKADGLTLYDLDTYDVVRVVLTLIDDHGQSLQYSTAVVTVSLEGPIEMIGPSTFSLIAGRRAFWVKSTGNPGRAKIKATCEGQMTETLSIEVISQ